MEENTKEVGLLETISGSGNERSILANEPKTVKLALREGCGVAEDPDGLLARGDERSDVDEPEKRKEMARG